MAEGYIIEKHPSGGKIHPTRRRADVYFHSKDADDFASLARLDSVEFTYGDLLDDGGRRCAIDVRRIVPEVPSPILRSPRLRARASVVERFYDLRRQTIARRWEAGEISLEHRAALCVDVEYARLTRLQKLTLHSNAGADNTTTPGDYGQEEEDAMAMAGDRQYGAVTRLTDRGFGFITMSSARRSFFFHATGVTAGGSFDALAEGDAVSFILESDDTGRPRAVDVRPLSDSDSANDSANGSANDSANGSDGDDGENSYNGEASA